MRGQRLARLIDRLDGDDRLFIVGDLCDFWFASRQRRVEPQLSIGLRALLDFRARGGPIELMVGNHDAAIGPMLADWLGAPLRSEPFDLEAGGLRLRLLHGHRLRAASTWKVALESRPFLEAFALLPRPLARGLDGLLYRNNERTRRAAERRHEAAFRRYADELDGRFDLVVFGHSHHPVDEDSRPPRVVVLGDWIDRSSYLRVADGDARLIIEDDPA